MTPREAAQLASKHDHDIRLASYTVEEKQHAKEIAKSSYLPPYETTAAFGHLTDTQLTENNAGSLGVAGGTSP
jgi:outer membrane protein TolC